MIICEIGKNFIDSEEVQPVSTNLEKAIELVRQAKEVGADVAKFQTHVSYDELQKRSERRKDWILRNEQATPFSIFWQPLKAYCDSIGIEFMTTPMSQDAVMLINSLVRRWKVGSADIVDMKMLREIKKTGKPVILSSGMSQTSEVEKAVEFFGNYDITLLHCVSIYPCPIKKINLGTIHYLKKKFPNVKIGFSDHTLSPLIPAYAVACGAEVIEKHFTLNRKAFGPDHKCSLMPNEFKRMVNNIRRMEKLLGDECKTYYQEEVKYHKDFRV